MMQYFGTSYTVVSTGNINGMEGRQLVITRPELLSTISRCLLRLLPGSDFRYFIPLLLIVAVEVTAV